MKFTVPSQYSGKTLKEFLYGSCRVSRATLIKLKALPDGILLNEKPVTVRAFLTEGDTVALRLEDRPEEENISVIPSGKLPPVLYEDDSVIVLDKPAGMPTHTSRDHSEGCLANAVCKYFNDQGYPFVFRAVNRLDSDTSGIVLVAKNRYYACLLSRSMANGEFSKKYLAILDGYAPERGKITGYISRQEESIIKRILTAYPSDGADYSETDFQCIRRSREKSLVLATPVTGRTHQLRLHFSSIGTPICGDFLYGSVSPDISRHALHACALTFPSPSAKKTVTVRSPLQKDMRRLAEKYGLSIPEWA